MLVPLLTIEMIAEFCLPTHEETQLAVPAVDFGQGRGRRWCLNKVSLWRTKTRAFPTVLPGTTFGTSLSGKAADTFN